MLARALQLWQEYQQRWNPKLFFRGGALRMAGANDSYETAALPVLKAARDWHESQTEAKRCVLLGS
jgi:hypothetical protein